MSRPVLSFFHGVPAMPSRRSAWLVALAFATQLACDPTNTYVVDAAFSGPAVVTWDDPTRQALDEKRQILVGPGGKAFVREKQPPSFVVRFLVGGVPNADPNDTFS